MRVLKKLLPAAFASSMLFGVSGASALTQDSINFFHTIASNVNLQLNIGNKKIASQFCAMYMTVPLPDPDANNHRQRLYNLCSQAVWKSVGGAGGGGPPITFPIFTISF